MIAEPWMNKPATKTPEQVKEERFQDALHKLNHYAERARPKDGSAPLHPFMDFGHLALDNWAEIYKRLTK